MGRCGYRLKVFLALFPRSAVKVSLDSPGGNMGMLVRDTGLGSRAHGSPVDGHFSVSFSQSAC